MAWPGSWVECGMQDSVQHLGDRFALVIVMVTRHCHSASGSYVTCNLSDPLVLYLMSPSPSLPSLPPSVPPPLLPPSLASGHQRP